MSVNIQEYIESGALEAYVTGSASEAEAKELLRFKEKYPEIQNALKELEQDMEFVAGSMAISPPPGIWDRISNNIDDLILAPKHEPLYVIPGTKEREEAPEREKYLEVEYQSSHMRVHKNWKWVFAAVFILSKIFLACAIYFYLENRHAQQQIQDLKIELKQLKIK